MLHAIANQLRTTKLVANNIVVGAAALLLLLGLGTQILADDALAPSYAELRNQFATPDHARWGEVPLWWWEGQPMNKERATAELEELASQGVKSVCPIQRSPGRCDPQSFTPEWWEMFTHVHNECKRLGMTLWAYDQVGYGHYGWLEKAAAEIRDPKIRRFELVQAEGTQDAPIQLEFPSGELIAARAYPLAADSLDDAQSLDISHAVQGKTLVWSPPAGRWRTVAVMATPYQSFYLSAESADRFIDSFYGQLERTLGANAMGQSFAGVFQDEHPPTPRDIYTEALATHFKERFGYEITRAIPALQFDVGPLTPKYRVDFFDAYLDRVEADYWKRIYDWTEARSVLTSHDNWGRQNIYRQSEGYIDYFRTQRWFSAPGFDDAGRNPLTQRNYYDTKIAASIARLYNRPRVWNEAFHTSGWGRTTEETLTWLTTGMVFGANLYDEHGLYYAINASTWEHAAPDPHWRQPYWVYYRVLSDFVARTSHLMSQGQHVVDAAVHYPVVSLLAGEPSGTKGPDHNHYMALSRSITNAGIDNDIIDDDSILGAAVKDGTLTAGGNQYKALVFGPETTIRRAVLQQALALVESGGTVIFCGQLPTASVEGGRGDEELHSLLDKLLGKPKQQDADGPLQRAFPEGGFCAFLPEDESRLPELISQHIVRDFIPEEPSVYVTHRRIGQTDVYLLQNALPGESLRLRARFRASGVPELWDPFTGKTTAVDRFAPQGEYVEVEQQIDGNTATLIVFRPQHAEADSLPARSSPRRTIPLQQDWEFSVLPTRNNRWGEFRWPPSDKFIGPEVRRFRYREENNADQSAAWHQAGLDDSDWATTLYSTGPYWLMRAARADDDALIPSVLAGVDGIQAGEQGWRELSFSQQIGLAQAAPWGGHSGYPDGHIDKNFIQLAEGRKLLFTRLRSPRQQRVGLRVELRNSTPRLWVNGVEQPFEDAVGNLPLQAGENTVLLDLPDGDYGRLFVQAAAPGVATMAEAARGQVRPEIDRADWIWNGETQSTYVRRVFQLDQIPAQARLTISAYSGYRLYVNGRKVDEEIGPWSNWRKPETYTITPYLRTGENVIAVWAQLFAGQNVNKGPEAFRSRGVVVAVKMRHVDDTESGFTSDGTWKGGIEHVAGWEEPGFDDHAWAAAQLRGGMGDAPWGLEVVHNVGVVTETKRPLSIALESPYLSCFDEVPDMTYDVKPEAAARVGWYRFDAPPGLSKLTLPTDGHVQAWVNGVPAAVTDRVAVVVDPPQGVSKVALRVQMPRGAYAGAAFAEPIGLELHGGRVKPGPWRDYALPTYSGVGVYTQTITLTTEDLNSPMTLDLGQVLVAAEVFVNGKSAGIRLARPFTFDLYGLLREGDNKLEVRVANTIAPHYTTIPSPAQGPTTSGLMGPVTLYRAE